MRSGTPVQRPQLDSACTGPRLPEHSNPKTTSTLFILRQFVDGQRLRLVDQAADPQAERGGIDVRVAVVLDGEVLIARRQQPGDRLRVEAPAVRSRVSY